MEKDRAEICRIISGMLDNPDGTGIYPTSTAYTLLDRYIEGVRSEAIGWAHAYSCTSLDNGEDPRLTNIPDMLVRAIIDLEDRA